MKIYQHLKTLSYEIWFQWAMTLTENRLDVWKSFHSHARWTVCAIYNTHCVYFCVNRKPFVRWICLTLWKVINDYANEILIKSLRMKSSFTVRSINQFNNNRIEDWFIAMNDWQIDENSLLTVSHFYWVLSFKSLESKIDMFVNMKTLAEFFFFEKKWNFFNFIFD